MAINASCLADFHGREWRSGAAAVAAIVLLPASAEARLTGRYGLLSEREALRGSLSPGEGAREEPWPVADPRLFAGLHLVQIPDPTPEVFVSRSPKLEAEEALIPDVLHATTAAQALALVDDPLNRVASDALPDGSGVTSVASAWSGNSAVEVTAEGTGGAVVGVRTTFLAGWTASQGGAPLPVIRVAGQELGAVVADVARGPIRFEYRVPRLAEAVAVMLVGLLLLALALRASPAARATG